MRLKIRQRAEGVVKRFEEMLPAEVAAQVDREHFDELTLLVEAAIGDIYATAMHEVAKEMEALAAKYRKQERILMEEL
ncbi:hypothetical protein [Sulfurivirga sp.]|uniref:hypothetical protein n=1 Tax=Sulfurivirga sp. TaxID=2614236 RepID=UPI0025F51718|nr:hypothetical protein [Sulfurivirga sp.]